MHRIACLLALALVTSSASAAPPNDACSTPTSLSGFYFDDTADLSTATTALDDPLQSCSKGGPSQNGHSIWYTFTAPRDGTFWLSTSGAGFDTVVSIHRGACGALTEIACEDDPTSFSQQAAASVQVEAGHTVLVEVTAFGSDPGGDPQVHGSFVPDSPLCAEGGSAFGAKLSIRHVGPPFGDEQVTFKAELWLDDPPVPGAPIVPSDRGVQILIEEGSAYTPMFELSQRTTPIPGNSPGCGLDDGWQVHAPRFRYRNLSNALPVGCLAGSANGLRQVDVQAIPPSGCPALCPQVEDQGVQRASADRRDRAADHGRAGCDYDRAAPVRGQFRFLSAERHDAALRPVVAERLGWSGSQADRRSPQRVEASPASAVHGHEIVFCSGQGFHWTGQVA